MISVHVPAPTEPARSAPRATVPSQEWKETLRDGTTVLIRPIRPSDTEVGRRFIQDLSPTSRRFRFLGEVTPSVQLLERLTNPDPARDVAFIALIADGARKSEIGVARFSARSDGRVCECAVVVSDEWQHRGLGTILMRHLIDVARERGIECMYSMDNAENLGMKELAEHLGFRRLRDPNDGAQVLHTLDLKAATV